MNLPVSTRIFLVNTGAQAYKPVEQLYSFDAEVFYVLQVDGKEIRTTSNHLFWVKDRGWVAADELAVGDQLETENLEYHTIEFIDIEYNPSQVYNFTVEDYHTYYISEQGYLTHNLLDACRLDKYATLSKNVTYTKGTPSEILRAEIIKHTNIVPPPGWQAHHIIGESHSNVFAANARTILARFNININSSANGVFLPKSPGEVFTVIDGQTLATHNGGHTNVSFEYVYDKISKAEKSGGNAAEKEAKVLQAINEIRDELLTGALAIGKVK
ncbi:polymorphic toxin-type HINT domain-containing protein [Cohnella sp.]|uniref:polymorphic toxin-type HINT domain-containing protein n=1 Tax=Cohnella sp. TaxID=1883426 RepID=UPI00356785B6